MPTPPGAAPDDMTSWRQRVDRTLRELASAIHNRNALKVTSGTVWVIEDGSIISMNDAATKRVVITQGAITPQTFIGGVWVDD